MKAHQFFICSGCPFEVIKVCGIISSVMKDTRSALVQAIGEEGLGQRDTLILLVI